jgi:hypothetical protein
VSTGFEREPWPEENLPPLKDWPPPEILARWEARKQAARRRRASRRRIVALLVVAALVVAGLVFVVERGTKHRAKPKAAGPRRPPPTVVWAVNLPTGSFVSVISNPGGLGPVAAVIPDETLVDVPGGPPTMGQSSTEPGLLLAATQATLNRRLDHFLLSSDVDLSGLLDRMGPIEVQIDEPFEWGGRAFGPGSERLTGGPAVGYLEAGTEIDRSSRWEEVLTGIVSSRVGARGWDGPLGVTDSPAGVRAVLAAARNAAVFEIPTAPTEEGGLLADPGDVADFMRTHFGAAGAPLVRVIVLTANGRKGDVIDLVTRLAQLGYRVVASQLARSRLAITQIVASDDSFVAKANQVQAILGVGSVYVAPDPSGVADITIVVGKDYKAA